MEFAVFPTYYSLFWYKWTNLINYVLVFANFYKIYFIFHYFYVCVSMRMCMWVQVPIEARGDGQLWAAQPGCMGPILQDKYVFILLIKI